MFDYVNQDQIKPRLLIVDDQASVITHLHKIFSPHFEVFMTTDAEKTLDLCLKTLPDLIILDVIMPNINGYELCEILKQNPVFAHTPVILISANEADSGEIAGFNAGAVDYLHKPIDSQIALVRVKNQLNQKIQADKLRAIALIDGLTEVANRFQLEEKLHSNWLDCARNQSHLSCLMIDIDHFKEFNDKYGHLAGDECIKQIAKAIKNVLVRPRDLVARYGGEEFCCILPNTLLDGAKTVAQHILAEVEKLKIPHETSSISNIVSVSIGVASLIPVYNEPHELLIKLADENLYRAKTGGRNHFVASDKLS